MSEKTKNRREFLAAVGAAGAASILVGSGEVRGGPALEGKARLAIDGGAPVRKKPLSSSPYGLRAGTIIDGRAVVIIDGIVGR